MREQLRNITPVILVGGGGTRMGAISSPECPKPFLPFADGSTLFMRTLKRLKPCTTPLIIGNAAHRYAIRNQAMEAGIKLAPPLMEDAPRNTAMAVATAVAYACDTMPPDALLAILPADHAIDDEAAWHTTLAEAAGIARMHDTLVLLGMQPTSDSDAFGYIAQDEKGIVTGFREKPADAAALRAAGWVWNSGQVIARTSVLAHVLALYAPDIWNAAQHAVKGRLLYHGTYVLAAAQAEALPFDKAVLEKAQAMRVIPCACGWSDIGTEAAFRNHAGYTGTDTIHPRIDRPWGYGLLIGRTEQTQSKELILYPHRRISLQRHHARDEHWSIIAGTAHVTLGEQAYTLQAGEAVLVPRGVWHRLENAGDGGILRVHEVQAGMPSEEDIERADDDYGRI